MQLPALRSNMVVVGRGALADGGQLIELLSFGLQCMKSLGCCCCCCTGWPAAGAGARAHQAWSPASHAKATSFTRSTRTRTPLFIRICEFPSLTFTGNQTVIIIIIIISLLVITVAVQLVQASSLCSSCAGVDSAFACAASCLHCPVDLKMRDCERIGSCTDVLLNRQAFRRKCTKN